MISLSILRHSALQILRQPKTVLQIFLLPNALAFFLFKVFGLAFVFSPIHMQVAINRGVMPWGLFVGLTLVSIVLWLWSALAWHRFILLGEYPKYLWPAVAWTAVPRFIQTAFFLCLGLAALLFGAVIALIILLQLVGVLAGHSTGWAAIILSVGIFVPLIFLIFRLALLLPQAAVKGSEGHDLIFEATYGSFWTFAAIFACIFAIRLGWSFLQQHYGISPFNSLGFWIIAVGEIIQSIFTISIITTLYGHYVEGRPLA